MSRVQVIEVDDKPVAYVVPADLWQHLKAVVEDSEDAADGERAVAADDGLRCPAAVALAVAEGTHPVKAWRTHRRLTLQALATAANLSRACVSPIECGQRAGTASTLKAIAAALGVPAVVLLPP
jgi:hypothetical protein